MAESLNFLSEVGLDNIRDHEIELTDYALTRLKEIPDVNILGNIAPQNRLGVVGFNVGDLNNNLVSMILNYESAIATRNGCFCAHPYLHFLLGLKDTTELRAKLVKGEDVDLPGAVRLTIGIYNTEEEVDELIKSLKVITAKKWKADYNNLDSNFACKELKLDLM